MHGSTIATLGYRLCRVLPLAGAILAAPPADAAPQGPPVKRLCKPRIEWTASADSRVHAQRKAIEGWSAAAAGQHGDAFTKWTIAGIARVSCTLTPEGHHCRAAASPCRDLNEAAPRPAPSDRPGADRPAAAR